MSRMVVEMNFTAYARCVQCASRRSAATGSQVALSGLPTVQAPSLLFIYIPLFIQRFE